MKGIGDEGVDHQIVDELRARDYSVTYIAEVAAAATDELLFVRVLVTPR